MEAPSRGRHDIESVRTVATSPVSIREASASVPPFASVYARHGPGLYRFCVAQVGAERAERLFHETMLHALRSYKTVPADLPIDEWLSAIATGFASDIGLA
jgi:DNA-directed RNA polymerase specialized sigma24 family protein